jgi:plasmid maintenance system antidote protein VapI
MKEQQKELINRLMQLQTKSELTTYDIAEYLGIEEEVVNIENGKSPLLASMVDELSKLYGVSVTRLMKDDNYLVGVISLKDYNVEDLKDIAKINKIALNLEQMKEYLENV